MPEADEPPLAEDLLDGATAVAAFVWGPGAPARRVYRAAETTHFPVFRVAGRLCARRSRIMQWIRDQENKGA